MKREQLIENTIEKISKLPDHKVKEVSDFAEFLLNKLENKNLTKGIESLASNSSTFSFLEEEEELYSIKDLKEVYNDKR
ncbi:DUF2281 domain-containing protein [Litoribacter ruber]|uniref:DUF2281 domain-containing protein n=1 Tax=Litoribacter ruber TaxID=702568 RepID=A0AAP2G5C2_9BACT|nr:MULTISPECIES: DUF2281 domain-containing protein [Litoribacter]MBS9525380.1 DUF2281 domain-containing protein [Litoribacter alkaliphilus]MBT0809766.1 DUF2281 domain-containing protein [Litoribacter ruber]